jgi:hypothetical protein
MNKDQQRFEEQDAPVKNTDNAFVKVKEDGSPDKRLKIDSSQEMSHKESPVENNKTRDKERN